MKSATQPGYCPSCVRFVGQLSECHYCGADMPYSDLKRVWKQMAALCAVTGVALLWYATEHVRADPVVTEQIKPSMNHALVKVSGRISSRPFVSTSLERLPYASFLLDDNSGHMRIHMQGEDALMFSASNASEGDIFEGVGVLRVQSGREVRVFIRSVKGDISWKLRP